MAQLIEAKYRLDDDEAIGWLNAAVSTSFSPDTHEIESVEIVIAEDGEKSLIVVVGVKG